MEDLREELLSFMNYYVSTDAPSFAQIVKFFESIITNDPRPPPKVDRFFTWDFYHKMSGSVKLIDVEELDYILKITETSVPVNFKPVPFEPMPFELVPFEPVPFEPVPFEFMPYESVISESVNFEPMPIFIPSNPLINQNINLPSSFLPSIPFNQAQLTNEHFADTDHTKDLPDMLPTKAQTSATIMPHMENNSNPWKSFTSCITPDDAQSHAESITSLVHETLANAKYIGAFSLHSGFDINTIGLPEPEQEIYIVLDKEISDDLSILLVQLANPFTGIVLTPNNCLSNLEAGIEASDDKESETELAKMSHSAPAISGLQEEVQVTFERSEDIDSCGPENTDKNESNESVDNNGKNKRNEVGKKEGGGRSGGGGGNRGGRRGREGGGAGGAGGSGGGDGGDGSGSGDGGGDDDPDDGNNDDNNIQSQKIFEIQILSTIQNSDGQESFSVTCNVHAAIDNNGTLQWTGPLLKVDIAKLHLTSVSKNFALNSCKFIISTSPATAAPSWSPELVPSYEISDTQEENSKTANASVTVSTTPSSNIGGQLLANTYS
ncbi:hypothetical protein C0993_002060 [Termitomyces sp. T159_Od127]|nr:hypothetical protein C0993_002060 [Termitomyces sp. T159_Od127]